MTLYLLHTDHLFDIAHHVPGETHSRGQFPDVGSFRLGVHLDGHESGCVDLCGKLGTFPARTDNRFGVHWFLEFFDDVVHIVLRDTSLL